MNLTNAQRALKCAFEAGTPIELIGAPGIGKTSIVNAIARERQVPLETLILSQCEPADTGGIPMLDGGRVLRLPLGPVRRACDNPSILFLDEFSNALPAVKAGALTLLAERWAGDFKLHPGTVIVLASNPVDQAEAGHMYGLPTIGRLIQIRVEPTIEEVVSYFEKGFPHSGLGAGVWRIMLEFSAFVRANPKLIELAPPVDNPGPWGSPRAWERGLRSIQPILSKSGPLAKDELHFCKELLAGSVGESLAATYFSLRAYTDKMPSAQEIVDGPLTVKIPKNVSELAAMLTLLPEVLEKCPNAAWVLAARIPGDFKVVYVRAIIDTPPTSGPFAQEASKQHATLINAITV